MHTRTHARRTHATHATRARHARTRTRTRHAARGRDTHRATRRHTEAHRERGTRRHTETHGDTHGDTHRDNGPCCHSLPSQVASSLPSQPRLLPPHCRFSPSSTNPSSPHRRYDIPVLHLDGPLARRCEGLCPPPPPKPHPSHRPQEPTGRSTASPRRRRAAVCRPRLPAPRHLTAPPCGPGARGAGRGGGGRFRGAARRAGRGAAGAAEGGEVALRSRRRTCLLEDARHSLGFLMWRRGAAHPLWRLEGGRAAAGSTGVHICMHMIMIHVVLCAHARCVV